MEAGTATQHTREQESRPERDPRIGDILKNTATWMTLQTLAGGIGYAGDDENPCPLPPATLSDLKGDMEAGLQTAHTRGTRFIPNALYFAFYVDKFKSEMDRSVPLPRQDFWWLAAPGDTVLLSDRIIHHYSTISDIDREAEKIFFLDQWPDRFFLKEGLNSAGVAARLEEGKPGFGITKAEFLRVAVGLITLDTPELIEHYFAVFPQRRDSYLINLGFGLSLLDVEKERFARMAAPYLKTALRLAEQQREPAHIEMASSKLFLALTVAAYQGVLMGDYLWAKPFQDELRHLTARFWREALLNKLRVDDVCRMGNAAANAKDFGSAGAFFDHAVARDPHHEQAHWLRAAVKNAQSDFAGVAADVSIALRLNEEDIHRTETQRDARDQRDRLGIDKDNSRLTWLRERRQRELFTRCRAHLLTEQYNLARTDAEAMIALAPDNAEGYASLAAIEQQTGNLEAARQRFAEALSCENNPQVRAAMEASLREVEKMLQSTKQNNL